MSCFSLSCEHLILILEGDLTSPTFFLHRDAGRNSGLGMLEQWRRLTGHLIICVNTIKYSKRVPAGQKTGLGVWLSVPPPPWAVSEEEEAVS